mmetsp:Transcript_26188/g.70849  ORF Transcript_26188/g.70849 Transcript_26188/m.70849 type:complete len:232 (+) Transcript_26188:1097-1792(+)
MRLSSSFMLKWGMRHELNGVASVLESFPEISSHMASKLNIPIHSNACALEQGLLFVQQDHPLLEGTVFCQPSTPYVIAASPDAKLVANCHEVLLELKCACPFLEKDDGRGWIWSPYKKALADEGVKVSHFVQCQVQMLAAGLPHCLLAGWEIEACKVVYVPFDAHWCKQMLCMLSSILLAAAPLSGRSPNFAAIPGHKEFTEFTQMCCQAVTKLCDVKSVKGPVESRWHES